MPAISFSRVDLPGAVAADDPEGLARPDVNVDVAQRPELARLRQLPAEDRLLQRAGRRERDLEPPPDAAAHDLAGRDRGRRLRARPQGDPRTAGRPRARPARAPARRRRCRRAATCPGTVACSSVARTPFDVGRDGVGVAEQVDQPEVAGRGRKLLEAVQDGREEEPRQEQHREQVFHVPEEDVHDRERPGEAERQADQRAQDREGERHRLHGLRNDDRVGGDQDREHHDRRGDLREDGRGRNQLARKPDLLDQVGVPDQRRRPDLHRGLEEPPDRRGPTARRADSGGCLPVVLQSTEKTSV